MASIYKQQPIDLEHIATYALASRTSKVTVRDFAKALTDSEATTAARLIDSMPKILAADTLRAVADRVVQAKAKHRPVIVGIGGHVIKTGVAPILIDLARRGFVHAIATNGSGVIHDFEIAIT